MAAIKALEGAENHALLKGLCEVFGIETDDLVITEILKEPATESSSNLVEQSQQYAQLAESIDMAIYEAVRTHYIIKNDGYRFFSWLENSSPTDFMYKNKKLFKSSYSRHDEFISVAPTVGSITKKFSLKDRSSGDIVGQFVMSKYAEDYCSSWHNFIFILNQRKQILSSMTENINIPPLKKALNDRIAALEEIITLLEDNEKDFNAYDSMSQEESARRAKRNQEKLNYIKSLPSNKKAMISKKRDGIISFSENETLLGKRTADIYNNGDLICANDTTKFGRTSTFTGVVTKINTRKPGLGEFKSHEALRDKEIIIEVEIDISN